jgi:hypothetical protein
MRPIRMALGSTTIDPALLTHAERLQHDGYLRREETYGIIRGLAKTGTPIKEIVRRTDRSRKLVRDIVRGGGGDVFRGRSNALEPHLAWLDAESSAGCRNGAELWRRLQKTAGFRGSLRVVAEWATRRRRAESAGSERQRIHRSPDQSRVCGINSGSRISIAPISKILGDIGVAPSRLQQGHLDLARRRDLRAVALVLLRRDNRRRPPASVTNIAKP